jgi:hypothetical protein
MMSELNFYVSEGVVCLCPVVIVNDIRLFMLAQVGDSHQLRRMHYKPEISGIDDIDDIIYD